MLNLSRVEIRQELSLRELSQVVNGDKKASFGGAFLFGGGEDVMKLPDKQEAFVREYMIDLNATQAYLRAGYKVKSPDVAKVNASRLLTNANVLARIQELQAERAKKLELDADWVLRRLKEISDKCMQAEPVMTFDYESKSMVNTGEYQFDSTGANKATELIGKHLGMFKERIEHSGEAGVRIINDIPRNRS